jgi:hypothetical protein
MWFEVILNYLKMMPNILCSCICSCIVLWLVNGWKISTIASDMRLRGDQLYMPHEIFVIDCLLQLKL